MLNDLNKKITSKNNNNLQVDHVQHEEELNHDYNNNNNNNDGDYRGSIQRIKASNRNITKDELLYRKFGIDVQNRRYPCCLVWTPIPLVTWFIPFIGHIGIGHSNGIVRDFAWPYRVSRDSKKYGKRLRILPLDPKLARGGIQGWDDAIEEAAMVFKQRPHLIIYSNCLSFVTLALNNMEYNGRSDYSEMEVFWLFDKHSVYIDNISFFKTWGPFFLIIMFWILFYICFLQHKF